MSKIETEDKNVPFWRSANMFGLLILVVAFTISVWNILSISAKRNNPDVIYVRIAHWQLEKGYRDALQDAIDDYNTIQKQKGTGIVVEQVPVTERFYAPWMNTQLISGTAPEISEMGIGKLTRTQQSVAKYYLPLGDIINQQNPYNQPEYLDPANVGEVQSTIRDQDLGPQIRGILEETTPDLREKLSTLPWRDTFVDGMRSGWDRNLKAYYNAPTTFFGIRLFYNQDVTRAAKIILREQAAKGEVHVSEEWLNNMKPPVTFAEFTVFCDAIRKLPNSDGMRWATRELKKQGESGWVDNRDLLLRDLDEQQIMKVVNVLQSDKLTEIDRRGYVMIPVSANSHSVTFFSSIYNVVFTSALEAKVDTSGDNTVSALETYDAFRNGVISFDEPHVRAYFEFLIELTTHFADNFIAADRDQVVFDFVQRRAAIMATGSWEAGTLLKTTNFDVAVEDFPMPTKEDKHPEKADLWRDYIGPPPNEASSTGGAKFGINKAVPDENKLAAVDFLKYLTSYRGNTLFNRNAKWIPIVIGSSPDSDMLKFMPRVDGIYPARGLSFSGNTDKLETRYEQSMPLLVSKQMTYQEFADDMMQAIKDETVGVDAVWYEYWKSGRNSARSSDRALATMQARLMLNPEDEETRISYQRALLHQVKVNNGNGTRYQFEKLYPEKTMKAD